MPQSGMEVYEEQDGEVPHWDKCKPVLEIEEDQAEQEVAIGGTDYQ